MIGEEDLTAQVLEVGVGITRVVMALLLVLAFTGCAPAFEPVSWTVVERDWEDTRHNSAESWWYAGELDGEHYIVIRRGPPHRLYRVSSRDVDVMVAEPRAFTSSPSRWTNLKYGQIRFLRRSSHASLTAVLSSLPPCS